ncbi:PAS domain S-box protein [Actinoplanes solisilvae]|uniref:sensor histidine kinase n=1 Tax=Actinoplanes solisilvae TaxID=2486853 RepID=UPI000FDA6AD1|nr:PAS domain S-box protein [Actinoplanes solisilvae]
MDGTNNVEQAHGTGDHALTRTSGQLMSLLVDAVDEYAIFMLDPEGRIFTWNTGARRIKGYESDEIIGRHFSVFYTPEDVRAGKPQRGLREAAESGHAHDEGWRLRRDGSRFWADVTITAMFDLDGHLEGFAKVTRDDTDRRLLDEQARRLELLIERERIAKGMHETVIHRIFEASMIMEGALPLIGNPVAAQHVTTAVSVLDATLKEIRTVILDVEAKD